MDEDGSYRLTDISNSNPSTSHQPEMASEQPDENVVVGQSDPKVAVKSSDKPARQGFMKIFDVTKIGHPQRPGENSIEGDPFWVSDGCYGVPQFYDPSISKSIAYYDYDHFRPNFYGYGFLFVNPKTNKEKFEWDPEADPFIEVPVLSKLQFKCNQVVGSIKELS